MKHAQSRARNAEIALLGAEGRSVESICDLYNLTQQYVYALFRKYGVKRSKVKVVEVSESRAKILRRRAAVAELHTLGISGGEAIRLLTVRKETFYQDVRRLGLKFPYDTTRFLRKGINSKLRASKMAALYRSGMTLQQIGDKYGLTRERVRQLMTKHEGIDQTGGGHHVKSVARRQQAKANQDARFLAKYGCTFDQYVVVREIGRAMLLAGAGTYQTPLAAHWNQKNNAKGRGIGWSLTFWQWWTIWQESGKWEQRGRARDAYVMSRFGDRGSYEAGNVYIGTLSENSSIQPNNPYRKDHPDHDKVQQKNSRMHRGCSVEGCAKPHYAHSYCNNHYYHFVTKARANNEQAAA